jgi:hypothetical protein
LRPIITLNQDNDTPARREITPGAVLTYVYNRSRDSRQHDAPGQDFVAYSYTAERIVFAVCDGVSQSFYGDLAARFLGEHLAAWLGHLDPVLAPRLSAETFAVLVDERLRTWVPEASALVAAKSVGEQVPPMLADALARKREVGSESMFVAGLIDLAGGQLMACWMGDMRLWVWDAENQPLDLPGAVWEMRERWSSRVGPKNGSPRVMILPLEGVARITAHSDGVGSRTSDLRMVTPERLDALARELDAAPASDDVAILDITLVRASMGEPLPAPAPYLPDADEPLIRWEPVAGAAWYRVAIEDVRTVDTPEAALVLPADLAGPVRCRVQAFSADGTPGAWSEPLKVGLPKPVRIEPVTLPEAAVPLIDAVSQPREFQIRLMLTLAIILALILSLGWYLMYFRVQAV